MFKSDRFKIGKDCSLVSASFVHYGLTMGDNEVLGPNALLMKGESLHPNSIWQGNPAKPVREAALQHEAAE